MVKEKELKELSLFTRMRTQGAVGAAVVGSMDSLEVAMIDKGAGGSIAISLTGKPVNFGLGYGATVVIVSEDDLRELRRGINEILGE